MKYLMLYMSGVGLLFSILMTHLLVQVALHGSCTVIEHNNIILVVELIALPVAGVGFLSMAAYYFREIKKGRELPRPMKTSRQ